MSDSIFSLIWPRLTQLHSERGLAQCLPGVFTLNWVVPSWAGREHK